MKATGFEVRGGQGVREGREVVALVGDREGEEEIKQREMGIGLLAVLEGSSRGARGGRLGLSKGTAGPRSWAYGFGGPTWLLGCKAALSLSLSTLKQKRN